MKQPFFSIVTPVYNGEKYIEETIKSVLNQSINDFEYLVVDNLSTDNTYNIIKKYSPKITKIISEKDSGMYDALKKGFSKARGKYLFWLNSDDFLKNDNVLFKLKEYLEKNPDIQWVNGYTNFKYEKYNFLLTVFPYHYPQSIIRKGYAHNCGWGFIQQESTIFSRKIFEDVGGFKRNYRMAGDYFLWKDLAKNNKLVSVNISIGVQRKWGGQMQNNLDFYYKEIEKKKCIFSLIKYVRIFYSFLIFLKSLILK